MAILLLISSNQVREPLQYLSDVIGIFEDSHSFSDGELQRFEFLTIRGTRNDVETRLRELDVIYAEAYLNTTTGKYQFINPGGNPETIMVWALGNKWFELVTTFKFRYNIDQLTAEEKQLIATIDIFNPSVDSAVRKIIKDLVAANPENGIEVKDLRNATP